MEAYIDYNYVCDKREEEYGDRYFGSVRSDDPEYDTYRRERVDFEEILYRARENMQIGAPVEMLSECFMAPSAPCALIRETSNDFADNSYDFFEENESALEERMKHMSDTFQE